MSGAIMDMLSQDWGTPQYLVDGVEYTFGGSIGLDPCSNPESIVKAATRVWLPKYGAPVESCVCGCTVWTELGADSTDTVLCAECLREWNPVFTETAIPLDVTLADGLRYPWSLRTTRFVNPPYGRNKADGTSIYDWVMKCAAQPHGSTIALIPAAVGTTHWQDIVFPTATCICFLRGRVKFLLKGKNNVSTTPSAMVLWTHDGDVASRFNEAFDKLGKVY